MKTSELRLGNWIQGVRTYKDKTYTDIPMFVESIFNDTIYADFEDNVADVWEYTESEIQGVPLTDDIFRKIEGVSVEKIVDDEVSFFCYEIKDIAFYESTMNDGYLVEVNGKEMVISYVHELQNLYFTLTKEELKIKL